MSRGVDSFSFTVYSKLGQFIGRTSKLIQSLYGYKASGFHLRVSDKPVKASSHNISSKLVYREDGSRTLLSPPTFVFFRLRKVSSFPSDFRKPREWEAVSSFSLQSHSAIDALQKDSLKNLRDCTLNGGI